MTFTRHMHETGIPAQHRMQRPGRINRLARHIRNDLRVTFARGDISSLVITWALLIVAALAVDAGDWTGGLGSLVTISILAVGFGFLLARSHYSESMALVLSTVYSMAAVIGINAIVLVGSGPVNKRVDTLFHQVGTWINQALAGDQPTNDRTVFVLFLSVLFWFLGHNSAWHVFRVDRVWRVIAPVGLVVITNQFYYQGDATLDRYLVAFVLLSLLLLIRSHIEAREFDWYLHRISFPRAMRRTFFQSGGVLALIVVLTAWLAPAGNDDKSLDRLDEFMSGETFMEMAELWNRLFSSLEGEGIATVDYYGGDELELTGAIRLGDQPVLSVQAPDGPRYYWRSTVYDTYVLDDGAWKWRHIRSVRAYTDEEGLRLNIGPTVAGARTEIEQTVTLLIRASNLVYTAPQPILLGLPVEAELDCVEDLGRTCVNQNRPSDVAIINARKTLRTSDTYTVTSSISTAPADALRSAGQDYPAWVLRLYLQGTDNVSLRVRDLAATIVQQAGAQTPYDQAKAIERWLRTNIQYNESIPSPPKGQDPIDWFLFTQHQGYCNYYATAMVLMLRSLDVPARMAAGFAQGTWDPARNAFLVRERDAHTWVEVYFPGYGWVEFEPTADEAPLDRQGDQTPQVVLPTMTPLPTATATPTILPTAIPPTAAGGANATPTSPAEQPFLHSTPTPTPSPTPSATPPPPLDSTKVDADGGSSILKTILLTLGLFALAVTLLVLLLLILIWYVEYRGLGGLNPIQRAYARIGIYARWLGISFNQSATPDERRRHLTGVLPEGEQPINTITHAYIRDRYADPRHTPGDLEHSLPPDTWPEARWAFIRRKLARLIGRD